MAEQLVSTFAGHADDSSSSVDEEVSNLLDLALNCGLPNLRMLNIKGEKYAGPIEKVVVADALGETPKKPIDQQRYQRRKPVYVFANILKQHLGKGESTAKETTLREVVRDRGYKNSNMRDDCGHIVARPLGGCMVDYNLFPQNKSLNRGWAGSFFVWKSLEYAMRIWLTLIPAGFRPRVEYSMLLLYTSSKDPHRPEKFEYLAFFYITRPRREGEEQNDEAGKGEKMLQVSRELINVAKKAHKQSKNDVRAQVLEIIRDFHLEQHLINIILEITTEFEDDLKIKVPTAKPSTPSYSSSSSSYSSSSSSSSSSTSTSSSSRPSSYKRPLCNVRKTTVIDFVPVLGSAKGISDGMVDLRTGAYVSGVANVALSTASLALDISTLGGASVLTSGVKTVGTVAVKNVARSAANSAIVTGVRKLFF